MMSPQRDDARRAFLQTYPVSRETEARLDRYAEMILERNQTLSLISPSTEDVIWFRHFLDSAQLLPLIPDGVGPVVDIGSGAGFPGLVLAIMGMPRMHLVEHNMRKIAFLETVVAELGLDVTLHPKKAEAIKGLTAGVVTARALKPLGALLDIARNLIGPETLAIFPKGRQAEMELGGAEARWTMGVERFASVTAADSTIFRLSRIAPRATSGGRA